MRGEITFLPPRTSTTDSVGMMICPILSVSPNAATRPSRLSFTFFSKPEYVCTMYHCFVEGTAPAAAASSCPSGISGASFNSLTSLPSLLALASSEFLCISHQPADDSGENRIRKKEIDSEKRDCHRHYDRGGYHVRARRPVHLLHFHAHIVQKRAKTLGIRRQFSHRLHQGKCVYAI